MKGQALLEAVFITPVLIASFLLILGLCYVAFARGWLVYQSDRALFCAAEGISIHACEKTAQERLARFLPFGRLKPLRLVSGDDDSWQSEVVWEWQTIRFDRKRRMKWDSSLWRQ